MKAADTRFLIVLAACLAMPMQAAAQSETDEADAPIVVTGSVPLTREQTIETVRRVAQPIDGQLARYAGQVCPTVTGLAEPWAGKVVARIRDTARRIGADVGSEGCEANLVLTIVDDGADFVRELSGRYPDVVAGIPARDRQRLIEEAGPARAWSTTTLTNSAGTPASRPEAGNDYGTIRVYEASNFDPSVQQVIRQGWVVIDTQATLGKSLTQVADYAAMRALAMVRPSELNGSEDTILTLFEPGAATAPGALTGFDEAYLTGLYRVPLRRWARSQVRYVADSIVKDAAQANP